MFPVSVRFKEFVFMQVDVGTLGEWFSFFNNRYFGGGLPQPVLSVGMSRTRLGSLTWECRRRLFRRCPGGYVIRISNYYDVDERSFKNVLLHEMIHLYIVSKGIRDTSPHGKVFRLKMNEINADGWAVSVTSRMAGTPKNKSVREKRQRIILAVEMSDGKRLLSVVNRRYVAVVDAAVKRSGNVSSHSWYVSDEACFSDYPAVRTAKGRVVSPEMYDRMVASMRAVDMPSLAVVSQK
jgi:hypothetical protein